MKRPAQGILREAKDTIPDNDCFEYSPDKLHDGVTNIVTGNGP